MANKKERSTQPTLFDVEEIARVTEPKQSTKVKVVVPLDIEHLGLVALTMGRSFVYKDFSDYIKSRKL